MVARRRFVGGVSMKGTFGLLSVMNLNNYSNLVMNIGVEQC